MTHFEIRHLLAHPPMFPDECFHSFRIRLAAENFYPSLFTLDTLCRSLLSEYNIKDELDYPSHPSTFALLGQLMGVDCDTLYGATPHRFAAFLTPPEKTFELVCLPSGTEKELLKLASHRLHIRRAAFAQFCPICLQQGTYHRVQWLPITTAACLTHKVLLVDRCSACFHMFSVKDVLSNYCTCGIKLSSIEAYDISNDLFGLQTQNLIQAWLMGEHLSRDLQKILALPEQSPRILYRIIHGLRSCVINQNIVPDFIHRFDQSSGELHIRRLAKAEQSPMVAYLSVATAVRALQNWPEGFHNLLEAQIKWKEADRKSLGVDLGPLLSHWLERRWSHTEYKFIQVAFNRYMVEQKYTFPFVMSWKRMNDETEEMGKAYMTMNKTMKELSTSYRVLNRMATKNMVPTKNFMKKEKLNYRFFEHEDITSLKDILSNIIGITETQALLGVSCRIVQGLIEVGLLHTSITHKDTDKRSHFLKSDVIHLLDLLSYGSQNITDDLEQTMSLPKAVYKLMTHGIKAADLILLAIERKIKYSFRDSTAGLRSILFDIEDINNLSKGNSPKLTIQSTIEQVGIKFILRYKIIEHQPSEILNFTGLTEAEFQMIMPLFEVYFWQYIECWTTNGKRRGKKLANLPAGLALDTPEDRLLFVLCYLQHPVPQRDHAKMFGLNQAITGYWLNLLISVLKTTLEQMDTIEHQSLANILARIGLIAEFKPTLPSLFPETSDNSVQAPRTHISRKGIVAIRRKTTRSRNMDS